MSINKFTTNLDLVRQAEIYSGETAVFQGGMQMGIPFSGFPTGVDTSTIVSLGVIDTQITAFSGDSGTTVFDVINPASPYYSVSATTLSASPYTILDTQGVSVTSTTYNPIMTFTAISGVTNNIPISITLNPPVVQEIYDTGNYGTLFNNLGVAVSGQTFIDESFYNVGSSFSGANINMEIITLAVHGSNPSWVTGTTSGTVIEYSGLSRYWTDSILSAQTTGLTIPITTLSADTQQTDYVWTLTDSTTIEENFVQLSFSGYSVSYSFDDVIEDPESPILIGGTGSTSGETYYLGNVTAVLENFSAGTLDYKGTTNWLQVEGGGNITERLTVDRLTINTLGSGSPVTMLAVDVSGNVVGGSGGTVDDAGAFTSTTINNRIIPTVVAGNVNDSNYSSILAGNDNSIINGPFNSFLGGGKGNVVSGNTYYSSLVGGQSNILGDNTPWSSIGGGFSNTMNDSYHSNIGGGQYNLINNSPKSAIGGGSGNQLNLSYYTTIGGGDTNIITSSNRASVVGGEDNIVNLSRHSSVGGGHGNQITGTTAPFITSTSWHTIGGGRNNFIHGKWNDCTIGGGSGNKILDTNTNPGYIGHTIGGGIGNVIDSFYGYNTIGGGSGNDILSISARSFIGGGSNNLITSGSDSLIGAGSGNIISGNTIQSSILGGKNNILDSNYSSIIGGLGNTLTHDNSFIIGTGLSSISANTTHVNKINIGTLGTGTSINNLGIDVNGFVVTGTTGGGGSGSVGGTGTTNTITKWLTSTGLTDSNILDDGTDVTIKSNLKVTGTTYSPIYSGDGVTSLYYGDGSNLTGIGNTNVVTGTTTVIDFSGLTYHFDAVSPSSSTGFTSDLTGAKVGLIQKIYSNHTSEPTYPAGWVLMGDAIYFTSTLNIIYAEWAGGTRVEYWYVQEQ
tara:strand:- start:4384 stop:7092 length:2709 start_codon:yes stop_codon:yes gene_type:complete